MKTNIKFNKLNYYVNTDKKVVTCIVYVTINGFHYQSIGKAKCAPDDTFDEVKGRRIAESRAKTKVYKAAYSLYRNIAADLTNSASRFSELSEFCYTLYLKEAIHVDELTNS